MKKIKQILALIGVVILIGLYLSTLVCALSGSENFMDMFMASVYATVVIPVLIWAYSFVYKLLKKHYGSDSDSDKS
jgi:dolichyl-phosphate-mannose--protein O-mannosyl transferase